MQLAMKHPWVLLAMLLAAFGEYLWRRARGGYDFGAASASFGVALGQALLRPITGIVLAVIFKAADRNNDGQVSRAELVNYRSTQWARIDRNGDGYFSRQDLPGLAQGRWDGEKIVGLRQVYDRNNDGRISRTEFVDGPSPAFDAADTNDDGVVNAAEMRSLAAQARG